MILNLCLQYACIFSLIFMAKYDLDNVRIRK